MTATTKKALAKLESDANRRKREAGKARHKALPKTVKCAFCGSDVRTKDTRLTPIGRGCKIHPGV